MMNTQERKKVKMRMKRMKNEVQHTRPEEEKGMKKKNK